MNIFRQSRLQTCGFSHENISCNFFPSFKKLAEETFENFLIKITTKQTSQKFPSKHVTFLFFQISMTTIDFYPSFFLSFQKEYNLIFLYFDANKIKRDFFLQASFDFSFLSSSFFSSSSLFPFKTKS